jgi:biopolymer transport protein ExbD
MAINRAVPEINAGSMADIAFLLLIFFLVTTQISEDRGLLVKLPPWSEEPPENLQINARNVLSVLVNKDNQLLVRGKPQDLTTLRQATKDFIANPRKEADKSVDPTKAIISLKNDRGTKYITYLNVYNELQAAYRELWDERSNIKFGKNLEFLTTAQQREIKAEIPLVLSEAESTAFGDN